VDVQATIKVRSVAVVVVKAEDLNKVVATAMSAGKVTIVTVDHAAHVVMVVALASRLEAVTQTRKEQRWKRFASPWINCAAILHWQKLNSTHPTVSSVVCSIRKRLRKASIPFRPAKACSALWL
jgi:hypothetical protein